MSRSNAVRATPENVLGLLRASPYLCLTAGHDDESENFARQYLCDSFLSKYTFAKGGVSAREREIATFKKWQSSELICYHTNVRLYCAHPDSLTGKLLSEMRKHIKALIGNKPPSYVYERGRFSGGATVDLTRGHHFTEKVCNAISCGDNNIIDACYALGYLSPNATFVPYGYCRSTQVPKSNKINRLIAIEPTASVFMQKALGSVLRQKLRRVGIDLDDQGLNQAKARLAYQEHLATIDLSAASDSVSLELVRAVMPYDWFRELSKHRSPQVKIGSRLFDLQKFSSMGNGYTFELESLLFWALCKSVCRDAQINVYGDDIIVSQRDSTNVINGLTMIGFAVNKEKSFTSGPFYESCGKHYFKGHDVTPCYQKDRADTLSSAMRMHNRLVRWALRGPVSRFAVIQHACKFIVDHWGHRDLAIPYGTERDDGWLVNHDDPAIKLNEQADFVCTVLCESTRVVRLPDECHEVAFRYKLHSPEHLNEDPKGLPGKPGRRVERRRRVVIWRSSIA